MKQREDLVKSSGNEVETDGREECLPGTHSCGQAGLGVDVSMGRPSYQPKAQQRGRNLDRSMNQAFVAVPTIYC
jgi:hypothetical protein